MSPDLGDLWRQSCPKSPEWEGELELYFTEKEEGNVASHEEEVEGERLDQTSDRQPIVGSGSRFLEIRTTGLQNCKVPLPKCGFSS